MEKLECPLPSISSAFLVPFWIRDRQIVRGLTHGLRIQRAGGGQRVGIEFVVVDKEGLQHVAANNGDLPDAVPGDGRPVIYGAGGKRIQVDATDLRGKI